MNLHVIKFLFIFFVMSFVLCSNKAYQDNHFTLAVSSPFEKVLTAPKPQTFELRCYVISDQQSGSLNINRPITSDEYDLVLILGDINKYKMDTIISMIHGVPICAVLGNHDSIYMPFFEPYDVHGKVVDVYIKRLGITVKVGGFGGALREFSNQQNRQKLEDQNNAMLLYDKASRNMPKIRFTEKEVARIMEKMKAADIFISHVPPSISSGETDRLHRGFDSFNRYIDKYKPQYWFHGHIEKSQKTVLQHENGTKTTVISVQNKLIGKLGSINITKLIESTGNVSFIKRLFSLPWLKKSQISVITINQAA